MKKVSDLTIAYIGGGSRGWAWNLMQDLAVEEQLSGRVKLYDIDFEAARINEVIGNNISSDKDAKGKWKYEAVSSLKEALKGADFVIISILPGTFELMKSDVHTPEKYGIYQSVGDTTGPGGILRAMRTIPMYVEIAEGIKNYSPNAWVINYTNPMTMCVQTLYTVFPEIKAFGCCHEVFGLQELAAKIVKMKFGEDVTRNEISSNVLGINHFTWIDSISYKDIDMMPVFAEIAEEYAEKGLSIDDIDDDDFSPFVNRHKVTFDLFKKCGKIAAAGDRHIVEFLPPKYLKNPDTVRKWGFALTKVDYRIENREELIKRSIKLSEGKDKIDISGSGEEGVKQLKALLGLGDFVTNVNVLNVGQIANLPKGHVVETNVQITKNSIRPIFAGSLDGMPLRETKRHVKIQREVVDASINKDKEKVFEAFLKDNLVRSISKDKALKMFNEMTENTKSCLKGWKI